jgi:hypothetical protein
MVRTAWAITIPGNTNTTIMPITPDNFIIIFSGQDSFYYRRCKNHHTGIQIPCNA